MEISLSVQTKVYVLIFLMISCMLMSGFHIYKINNIIVADQGKPIYETNNDLFANLNQIDYVDVTKQPITRIEMHEIFKHFVNMVMYLFVALLFFIECRRWEDGKLKS